MEVNTPYPPSPSGTACLDMYIERGGGFISGSQGLGILVGNDPKKCPAGWIFVDADAAKDFDHETRLEIMQALKEGRERWPD